MRQSPEIPAQKLLENYRCSLWDLVAWGCSPEHTCSLRMLVIAIQVTHDSSISIAFAGNIRSYADCCKTYWENARHAGASSGAISQSECVVELQLIFLQCTVSRSLGGTWTSCKTPGTDGRLSLNGFEIRCSIRKFRRDSEQPKSHRIPRNFPVFRRRRSAERQEREFDTLRMWYFFVYIVTASVAFSLPCPSRKWTFSSLTQVVCNVPPEAEIASDWFEM
jgi:hypothetical protein